MTHFSSFLDPQQVVFLQETTRNQVIHELVQCACTRECILEESPFLDAVMGREKVVSTGIGLGVALPHAKLPEIEDFFIVIGIAKVGISWESLDHAPVHLVFLVGGPDDKQTEYLQLLSSLTMAIKEEGVRDQLLTLTKPEDIVTLLSTQGKKDKEL